MGCRDLCGDNSCVVRMLWFGEETSGSKRLGFKQQTILHTLQLTTSSSSKSPLHRSGTSPPPLPDLLHSRSLPSRST